MKQEGKRYALLIGINNYHETYENLDYPEEDVKSLEKILADSNVGAFEVRVAEKKDFVSLRNEIGEFFAGKHPKDTVLFYFSGHGKIRGGKFYFVAENTIMEKEFLNGLEDVWVKARLEDCKAKNQIVILDCCHSGEFIGSKGEVADQLTQHLKGDNGRYILASSKAYQLSHKDVNKNYSAFTSKIIQGIETGEADKWPTDGKISVVELSRYVKEQMKGEKQTPVRDIKGKGELFIAINPFYKFETPSLRKSMPIYDETALKAISYMKDHMKKNKKSIELEAIIDFNEIINLEHILILYTGAGTCIFYKSFGLEDLNTDLISGFITAAGSYERNYSREEISEITYGGKAVLIGNGEYITVALITSIRASISLREKLKEFIIAFERRNGYILPKWRGKLNNFVNTEQILDEIFNTSIILPHRITDEYFSKKFKNRASKDLLKIAITYCEETERDFLFIATLLEKATEIKTKNLSEILLGIKELKDKKILVPIKLSEIKNQLNFL